MNNKIKLMSVLLVSIGVLAGCKDDNSSLVENSSTSTVIKDVDSSSFSSSINKNTMTEEELFVEFKKVYDSSLNEDKITYQIDNTIKSLSASSYFGYQDIHQTNYYSLDKVNGQYLKVISYESIDEYNKSYNENISKVFIEEDKKYLFESNYSMDDSAYQYYSVITNNVYEVDKDYIGDRGIIDSLLNFLPNINKDLSYETYQNNFYKSLDEFYFIDYNYAKKEMEVKIQEVDQGIELSIYYLNDEFYEESFSSKYTYRIEGELTFRVEDSKLVSIKSGYNTIYKKVYTKDEIEITSSYDQQLFDTVINIEYDFDQEKFDSIEVKMPDEIVYDNSSLFKPMVFDFDGVEVEYDLSYTKDTILAKEILEEGIDYINYYDLPNTSISADALYYDKEKTKKVNLDEVTIDYLLEVDRLYGDIEVDDGYVIVQHILNKDERFSEKFKTCFTKAVYNNFRGIEQVSVDVVSKDSTMDYLYGADTVLVNGEKVDIYELYELGEEQKYVVEYFRSVDDSDINLAYFFTFI